MLDVKGVNFHKKQRNVTKVSLTKSSNKLIKLEADSMSPDTFSVAQGLASKLKSLDTKFKTYHS